MAEEGANALGEPSGGRTSLVFAGKGSMTDPSKARRLTIAGLRMEGTRAETPGGCKGSTEKDRIVGPSQSV